jgi:hydroxyethylthiazole kinase
VILDPVGAGASGLRTETTFNLLKEINFTVIRGNISEIKTVALGSGKTKGVDANVSDAVSEANLPEAVSFIRSISQRSMRSNMQRNTGSNC